MTETTNPHIEQARDAVDRERRRIEDELTAFTRFLDRLSRVECDGDQRPTGTTTRSDTLLVRERGSGRSIERVEAAYRDTVMSTPHYDDDYGNSFPEDVAAEFGPEIAHVLNGSDRLGRAQRRAIRSAAEHAKRERVEFLRTLRAEVDSLERIDRRLSEVEREAHDAGTGSIASRSFDDLLGDRELFADLEETCEGLVDRRQAEIHTRSPPRTDSVGATSLVGYLYSELDAPCPALADAVAVLGRLRRGRRRRERALSQRR